jgi:NADP-dependent 3-hydroxy acid dehydrogenase YdfG
MDPQGENFPMPLRKVLITGSSSGIGEATVDFLLEQGHEVWGIARREDNRSHPRFHAHTLDLIKIHTLRQKDFHLFTEVDAVILNAGQGLFGHLEKCSIKQIQQTFELNTLSPIYLVKYLLPNLKKKQLADIIFIGSEAALAGKKEGSVYCASKFALRGFAQSLRLECASTNVRISMIQPGMVRTPFFDSLSFKPQAGSMHALSPNAVASAVQMVLSAHPETIFDEILLTPQKRAIEKKK